MIGKITILVTISLIFFGVLCETKTPVRICSDDLPFPLNVQIQDCEAVACVITRGKIQSMDVQFVAVSRETYKIDAEVRATVLGIVIPYPLPNDSGNVCANLLYGAYCPLYAGEDVIYHLDFPLENSVPEVSVKLEVKLFDQERNVVTCFIADLKVKKP